MPPDFDPNSEPNGFRVEPSELDQPAFSEGEPVTLNPQEQERLQSAQQKLQRLFLFLLGIGVLLGIVVAIALVFFLNRFGLVGAPEGPRQHQQNLQQILLSGPLLL